jgi:predicted HD phosphohydrolase
MTSFARLQDATPGDWAEIERVESRLQEARNAGYGLLKLLRDQRGDDRDGWPVNIYDHCLQAATRAHQAGETDEIVFCALFHDATEVIAPHDHGAAAALLLSPYISNEHRWLVEHHGEFQNRFAHNHPFRDRTAFDKYRGHPAFELTMRFCERYDENSFDRSFAAMPLEAFEPLVDRICRSKGVRAGGA